MHSLFAGNPRPKVGFLTGGQLGLMCLQELIAYPVETYAFDKDPQASCAAFVHHFTQGDPLDADQVYEFGKDLDLIIVEFEHVSTEGLKKLKDKGVRVVVDPEILEVIQNKGEQKKLWEELGLNTAEFRFFECGENLANYPELFPAAIKTCKGGYDGGGVEILKDCPADYPILEPVIVEQLIDFEMELSIIVCRDFYGNISFYPLVEQVFCPKQNLVELLAAPAEILSGKPELQKEAEEIARKVVEAFDYHGVMAVELFLNKSGELLINEVAPRVHNSGHHTIEANITSQFAQHVRIALGLKLGSTEMVKPAAMANLLGAEGFNGPAVYEGIADAVKDNQTFVHTYNKLKTKPHRKMGHLTVLADSVAEAKARALELRPLIKIVSK